MSTAPVPVANSILAAARVPDARAEWGPAGARRASACPARPPPVPRATFTVLFAPCCASARLTWLGGKEAVNRDLRQ